MAEIVCADALEWLPANRAPAIVTSPPDASEVGLDPGAWREWFVEAVHACIAASDGPVVFYVTDRKADGGTYSKAALVTAGAVGARLVWHKIALRRDVGAVDLHRPGFSHLLAFNGKPGKATADVFPRGRVLYPNGTGLVAARVAVEWVSGQASGVVDPFCGQGTIPAVAEALGLKALGVDLDERQCEKARALVLRAV